LQTRETMRMKKHPQYFISKPRRSPRIGITIGIDLGDIWSHYCTLNEDGEVVDRGRFRTNPSGVDKRFRDLAKPCGRRLPASSTLTFANRCVAVLPPGLARALGPLRHQIADMTVKIKEYDRAIKQLTETEYPETQALIKVYGVGHVTALTVLTLGNKQRFQRSRDVGCYLGLRPRRSQSGNSDPQLGITKAGNEYLRQLLVECANHVIGPLGKDSTLRRWGLNLGARGGSHARRRAVVAVARKLAVLLHRIWITQEVYVPFYEVAA
jgi:transposase